VLFLLSAAAGFLFFYLCLDKKSGKLHKEERSFFIFDGFMA